MSSYSRCSRVVGRSIPRTRPRNIIAGGSRNTGETTSPSIQRNTSANDGVEKDFEWNFQFSSRANIGEFDERQRLVFGYTNRTFWQVTDESSPIRTTDNSPELFWEYDHDSRVTARLGVMHQSNGDGGADSRNWNRLIGEVIYRSPVKSPLDNSWLLSVKPWMVFHRDPVNNSDIEKYLGHFELTGEYAFRKRKHSSMVISWMLRNNLRHSGNRGAVEVSFSWGTMGFRPFIQFFNGYGESLVDYNDSSSRLSIGLEFLGQR